METITGEMLWENGRPIGRFECIDAARFRGERLRMYRSMKNHEAKRIIMSADTGRVWLLTGADTIRQAIECELIEE